MKKILEFFAEKNRWAILLVIILLLVGGGIFKLQRNKIAEWKQKHQTEVNLNTALNADMVVYQNKEKEWVSEKLTMQASLKQLDEKFGQLSDSQKELVDRVKKINRDNTVITAALIEANVKIDSLLVGQGGGGEVVVDTVEKKVNFNNLVTADSTTNFVYDIDINHVLPAHVDVMPTMLFKSLDFPNKQLVTFEWKNDKKRGYPISFSTTNSNGYYKTYDINSYAIPELYKETLDPTGWQKVGYWFKKNSKIVGWVAGGIVVGATGTYIIMQ